MDRYVAFLRGMNLGGRRITNDDLRLHFEVLACGEVATQRQRDLRGGGRAGREVDRAARSRPGGVAGKQQVALLREPPPASARKEVLALSSDSDRLAIEGRELYWLPEGGISESDLDLAAIGALLGLTTIRTKGTIEQIALKHFQG